MKKQEYGKPDVNLSWIIKADSYAKEKFKTTLDNTEGKLQLADTILMLIEQGMEIRLGTDGYCLMLEANLADDEYSDSCYQYIDDDHFVGELTDSGDYPDYYPETVGEAIKDILDIMSDTLPQSIAAEFIDAEKKIYEKYKKYLKAEEDSTNE